MLYPISTLAIPLPCWPAPGACIIIHPFSFRWLLFNRQDSLLSVLCSCSGVRLSDRVRRSHVFESEHAHSCPAVCAILRVVHSFCFRWCDNLLERSSTAVHLLLSHPKRPIKHRNYNGRPNRQRHYRQHSFTHQRRSSCNPYPGPY